jgi:hypothetical protein
VQKPGKVNKECEYIYRKVECVVVVVGIKSR